jgi:hypothetical protein
MRYADEGEGMYNSIVTGDESWYITTNPNQSALHYKGNIPVHLQPKIEVTPSAGKVMLTMFWDSQVVLLTYCQKQGENVNSASYCEAFSKLRDVIRRKHSGQLARGVLFHHKNARPRTARETREKIQELNWKLLEHPPYSPDLSTDSPGVSFRGFLFIIYINDLPPTMNVSSTSTIFADDSSVIISINFLMISHAIKHSPFSNG